MSTTAALTTKPWFQHLLLKISGVLYLSIDLCFKENACTCVCVTIHKTFVFTQEVSRWVYRLKNGD